MWQPCSLLAAFWLLSVRRFGRLLCCLFSLGSSLQLFTTSTASFMQVTTEKRYRGRVMAVVLATALGSTALGAPLVGWIADVFGARWAIGMGSISGIVAASLGFWFLRRQAQTELKNKML